MPELLSCLRAFNRKERFLLMQWVLDRPGFPLGDRFRRELEDECGVELGGDTVVAVDYHLDWLYAALRWASDSGIKPTVGIPREMPAEGAPERLITGSQEDVDLLVASAGKQQSTTLLLCEAKAYTPGNSEQLESKVERLRTILSDDVCRRCRVTPRFVLLGPRKPVPNPAIDWPAWMKHEDGEPYFIAIPPPEGRYAVHREHGGSDWTTWKIVSKRWED